MASDWGMQFNSKFIHHPYKWLGIQPSFSSAYHPQTGGQTEWVNQSIEHFLWGYISHEQDDWVKWLPMAEFIYNNAKHRATGMSPFQAVYGWDPTMMPSNVVSGSLEVDDHTGRLWRAQEEIQSSLCMSKERMVNPDTVAFPSFEDGDKVWLSAKNIQTTHPAKKLDHQHLGLFPLVEKVSDAAYHLKLLPSMKAHNVFHIDLLSKPSKDPKQHFEEPTLVVVQSREEEYEVKAIIGSKHTRREGWLNRVCLKSYGLEEDTWEPQGVLKGNAVNELRHYHKAQFKHT